MTIVTDSTADEKKIPRNNAAPLARAVERKRERQRDDGQRRHDHQRHFERVDERRSEDRIVGQPTIIADADEMAVAEQVDLVEAEPQPAQQREDQDERNRAAGTARRTAARASPVRRSRFGPGDSRCRRLSNTCAAAPSILSGTSSPIFTRLSPSSSAVIGWPSASRA